MVPDAQQPDEPKDHKFGSYCFEELEPAKVLETVSTEVNEPQEVSSEDLKCPLKSWESSKEESVMKNYERNPEEKQPQANSSESQETSQNLWVLVEVESFEFKFKKKPPGK